jgi:hypothetical protein
MGDVSRGDRVRVGALVLIALLAALAAGIGVYTDHAVTGPPTVGGLDPRCQAFERDGVPAAARLPRLPDDVTVIEAMWCTRRSPGTPVTAPVVELHATQRLDLVTAAFRRPDVRRAAHGCPTPQERFGRVWLRTAEGTWIEPRWPQADCGPRQDALDLLTRVPFRVRSAAT